MAEPRIIGITFQGWKALAIREGLATVTRRLVKPQPVGGDKIIAKGYGQDGFIVGQLRDSENAWRECKPRYRPRDVCYVKEAWRTTSGADHRKPSELRDNMAIDYLADGKSSLTGRYRHARFMPPRFARTWVEMVDVRPERVQEMPASDVVLEGFPENGNVNTARDRATKHMRPFYEFIAKWDQLHGDAPWSDNPWVWRYQFRLTEAPDG